MTPAEFATLLRSMPAKLANIDHTETLQSAAAVVEKSVRGNFQRQTRADGRTWEPRRVTILPSQIRGKWFNHPLLILTGKMIGAATGGHGHYRKISKTRLEMGIDPDVVPYARTHQDGGESTLPNGRVIKIPSRQYFYLHGSDRQKMRALVLARTRAKFLRSIGRTS
jgi:phage gpG-like protein